MADTIASVLPPSYKDEVLSPAVPDVTPHVARVLDMILEGFLALDAEDRYVYINRQAEVMLGRSRQELLGVNVWDAFPGEAASDFGRAVERARTENTAVTCVNHAATLGLWFESRIYPSPEGLLFVYFRDITEQRRLQAEAASLTVQLSRKDEEFQALFHMRPVHAGASAISTVLSEVRLETEIHARREALLGRIRETLRQEADPASVLDTATRLLGEALQADRCYQAVYDQKRGVVTIASDWHRTGLPSIQGVYPFSNTAGMFRELYEDTDKSVAAAPLSAQTLATMDRLGLRSRVSAPVAERSGFLATLTAAMVGGPRAWTEDEAALVEAVAAQVRVAVELARVAQREHRLAEQFQAALQPATPASVPGMELASFYRPAWEDHGVGGDFSDVFAADKGVTYLVVGDLSGKGIPAASQVQMVRHMLRFALHNGRSLSDAVTALNATLADNELIDGFATLFVGRFDAHARLLSFVNAGQDAGLVLRAATGEIVALPSTGPVLGALSGAQYAEEAITLEAGDVLALYTDGLTEAGPSRTALLTGDGVADLLRGLAGRTDPDAIVGELMAGVDAHAKAGIRDDQCLLVGVAAG